MGDKGGDAKAPANGRPPTLEEFEEAMKKVLSSDLPDRAKYENKKPTPKQLRTRFRLAKKPPKG